MCIIEGPEYFQDLLNRFASPVIKFLGYLLRSCIKICRGLETELWGS